MIVDEGTVEVVMKPRNTFSNGALRRVVPPIDLRKKKESLSMSMINMGSSGRFESRLFVSSLGKNKRQNEH